jgi:hypothetical protein
MACRQGQASAGWRSGSGASSCAFYQAWQQAVTWEAWGVGSGPKFRSLPNGGLPRNTLAFNTAIIIQVPAARDNTVFLEVVTFARSRHTDPRAQTPHALVDEA